MKSSYIWFVPAICVALGILLLSTVFAVPIQIEGVSGIDKVEHAFAYFVLTFSFLLAFHKAKKNRIKIVISVIVLSAFYGLCLEYVQYYFFEYRLFEWKDALANLTGVLLGLFIFKLSFRG
ncbi:MAG: VanZ family protein [Ekhidna sp.]